MAKKIQEQQYLTSRINTPVMDYRIYVMKPIEKLVYTLVLGIIGGCMGLIFYGGLFKSEGSATLMTIVSNIVIFVLAAFLANRFFLSTLIESLRKKRIKELRIQFCDFVSALTNALASGMNMNDALNAVYRDLQVQYPEEAYIVQEVKEIMNGITNNVPIEVMLEDFGTRSGEMDIANFATVFSTCYRTGGNIKSVVRRTTEIISEKIMIASEIETAVTSNKMQMNVMNVLPIVIILMMRLMSAEFAESFGSIIGVIGLTISAGLTLAAYKMGQKIIDIKG